MNDRINYYIFLPLIFFAFLLETAFLPSLIWGDIQPELVLIALIASVFLSTSSDFLYTAFLLGIIFDFYFGASFGVFTVSMVLTSVFASLSKDRFMKEESFGKIIGLSVSVMLFYNLLYLCLLAFAFGAEASFDSAFIWKKIFFDSLYAIILIFPVMRLISNKKQ
ncbi:MAG: rod shape-determining protein MreD [Candidatus Pacebacteria bacterium]|nr:rod shape-determining protein MreD [Candidatus Paceibacterota bacterium]